MKPQPYAGLHLRSFQVEIAILKLRVFGFRYGQIRESLVERGLPEEVTWRQIMAVVGRHRSKMDKYAERFRERAVEDAFAAVEFRIGELSDTLIELDKRKFETDEYGRPTWMPQYLNAFKLMGSLQGDMGLTVTHKIPPKMLELAERAALAHQEMRTLPENQPSAEAISLPKELQNFLDEDEAEDAEFEIEDAEATARS